MKYFSVLFLVLMTYAPFLSLAQDVDISKSGLVSVDGEEVFVIEGKMGMVNTSFSVYNIDGDLLIAADGRSENNYMTVTFSGNNSSLDYPLTIGLKKAFAKDLARMQVIKDGQLNPEGMKRFIAKYNGRAERDLVLTDRNSNNLIVVEPAASHLIQRNRNAPVFIRGKMIVQDQKELGMIDFNQEAAQGQVLYYFTVSDLNGITVANATKKMSEPEIEIVTRNRIYTVQAKDALNNRFALEKIIVEELIKRGAL